MGELLKHLHRKQATLPELSENMIRRLLLVGQTNKDSEIVLALAKRSDLPEDISQMFANGNDAERAAWLSAPCRQQAEIEQGLQGKNTLKAMAVIAAVPNGTAEFYESVAAATGNRKILGALLDNPDVPAELRQRVLRRILAPEAKGLVAAKNKAARDTELRLMMVTCPEECIAILAEQPETHLGQHIFDILLHSATDNEGENIITPQWVKAMMAWSMYEPYGYTHDDRPGKIPGLVQAMGGNADVSTTACLCEVAETLAAKKSPGQAYFPYERLTLVASTLRGISESTSAEELRCVAEKFTTSLTSLTEIVKDSRYGRAALPVSDISEDMIWRAVMVHPEFSAEMLPLVDRKVPTDDLFPWVLRICELPEDSRRAVIDELTWPNILKHGTLPIELSDEVAISAMEQRHGGHHNHAVLAAFLSEEEITDAWILNMPIRHLLLLMQGLSTNGALRLARSYGCEDPEWLGQSIHEMFTELVEDALGDDVYVWSWFDTQLDQMADDYSSDVSLGELLKLGKGLRS